MTKAINTIYLALFIWVLLALMSCRSADRTVQVDEQRQEHVDSVTEVRQDEQVSLDEMRQKLEQVERQADAFYEHVRYTPPDSSGKQYVIDRTTASNKVQEQRNTIEMTQLQAEAKILHQSVTQLQSDMASYERSRDQWRYNVYWFSALVAVALLQIVIIIVFYYIKNKRP